MLAYAFNTGSEVIIVVADTPEKAIEIFKQTEYYRAADPDDFDAMGQVLVVRQSSRGLDVDEEGQ